MILYDKTFYDSQYKGSISSAEIMLKLLFNYWSPNSIIDFGCGVGSWLYAAEKLGVTSLYGVDGPWVSNEQMLSDNIDFIDVDFSKNDFRGIPNKSFDLAVSVEVAEHLSPVFSSDFVDAITSASDIVVFGAAVPLQDGLNHINEQPQSYWINKFNERGFNCYDFFRPKIWDDSLVEVWYRQNTFLFVKEGCESFYNLDSITNGFISDVIHPELFATKAVRHEYQLADRLRDTAIKVESINLDLALQLMELARDNRPDGDFINSKLNEYRSRIILDSNDSNVS